MTDRKNHTGGQPSPHESMMAGLFKTFQQQAFTSAYARTFDVQKATTDADRAKVFALRYQVYCLENKFIPPAGAEEIERDAFDEKAAHFILTHRETQSIAGTVRVLFPDEHRPLTSFEMQQFCDHPLLQLEGRIRNMCEISRFCMSKQFRRRPGDGQLLPAYFEQEWSAESASDRQPLLRRRIPFAPLGLMKAAFDEALERGITNCLATLESKQFHTMKRLGFNYRVMGPRVDYHGIQQPLIFNIKAVLDSMAAQNRECWEVISDKGRLHELANVLYQHDWGDSLFDDAFHEASGSKIK